MKADAWWERSVVYQIYPRSFCDSNGDGIGDLQGIISKLGYLQDLGVDLLWLSPVFASPMRDNGYDISDYYAIAPEFGSMEDMERLIREAGKRGMRLLLDLVVHHTSDQHPWFQSAVKNKNSPFRDYYVWRKSIQGGAGEGLQSIFGGSAWEFSPETGEFYLHMFSRHQPDLNWNCARLREDIYRMMNFWIGKGIGGFRIDVLDMLGKDVDRLALYETEETHAIVREMNRKAFGPHGLMTVGEASSATPDSALRYAPNDGSGLSMVFQFEHVHLDRGALRDKWSSVPLDFPRFKQALARWQGLAGRSWNSLYLNNHDQPRALSRWGNDQTHRVACARMMALMLHLMWGTPFVYQGEEIGMTNAGFARRKQYRDVDSLRAWDAMEAEGIEPAEIVRRIQYRSRDNARTPMQWTKGWQAGFTAAEPWIEVNPNHIWINAEEDRRDPGGVFHFYRQLIALRRQNDTVVRGAFELLMPDHPEIFAYLRKGQDETLLVICNFFGNTPVVDLPASLSGLPRQLLLSSLDSPAPWRDSLKLRPYEGLLYAFSHNG